MQSIDAAQLVTDQHCIPADLLTGADLDGGEDADSVLSDSNESAGGHSMGDGSHGLVDEEQEDEDAAMDDVVTAKGNHKRREDKKLLPTEDKFVALCFFLPSCAWPCQLLQLRHSALSTQQAATHIVCSPDHMYVPCAFCCA